MERVEQLNKRITEDENLKKYGIFNNIRRKILKDYFIYLL
jgi:hypothetical protein